MKNIDSLDSLSSTFASTSEIRTTSIVNRSRNEIVTIFKGVYTTISKVETTSDKDLVYIIENLESKHIPFERPDAYMICDNVAYGIEHFQISQYSHKKGDQGKAAEGAKAKRDKLRGNKEFNLEPSIANLNASLRSALEMHMKHVDSYKKNVLSIKGIHANSYRLVILIEDVSDQASYVQKYDTNPRNPLLFDDIANMILEHKSHIWGVIYIGGNSFGKALYGFTVDELSVLKNQGKLLNMQNYRTLHSDDQRVVSKDDESKDEHIVMLKLYDRISISDRRK